MTAKKNPTKTASKSKKASTGKRYSDEQKKEILAFVESQGRGGISAAGKKYGVSYIALRRWMNVKSGLPASAKDVKPKRAVKVVTSPKSKSESAEAPKGFKMLYQEIKDEMTRARNDFNVNMTKLEMKLQEIFA